MGSVLVSSQTDPSPEVVDRVAEVLRDGGVAVLPTDSVYGICCAATPGNPGHARIFDVKRRERTQTLPWFVADASDLARYGRDVPAWALRLAERHWPRRPHDRGPRLRRGPARVRPARPRGTHDSPARAGLRARPRRRARRGRAPRADERQHARAPPAATSGSGLEPGIVEAVDLVVDAGPAPVGVASTIVDATGPELRILRLGALAEDEVLLAARR